MEYIETKSALIRRNSSGEFINGDYGLNIYKGCSHGCIYCDSRSSCYGIEDFDTVRAKKDILNILELELMSKRETGVIDMGSMSDPYNPHERKENLTRDALQLIDRYMFGVTIFTKSDLILRDIDLLKKISEHSPVTVAITITTSNDILSKKIEPNVVVSSERIQALKTLRDNNIFSGILMTPLLPFLEDNEENINGIIKMAKEAKVNFIYPMFGVTLRDNQRDYYYEKLDELFPNVKEKYISTYGDKYDCNSTISNQLYKYFSSRCKEEGILYKANDIVNESRMVYENRQLRLF